MSKLNFHAMSKTELRSYAIAHQDDREAFYALVDRLMANRSSVKYPTSMTSEEIHKAVLEHVENKRKSADSQNTA